ncbi:S1 RNA-binding domain-containing protein [Desulforhopalus sp. IMCC35007]|uniref:CvfB family protein n=1 Tax=Desulforhopalus sp. IMCC35007 TaxID=2569543 RepID=UPI0010AEA395|nr:S1-like domain-containing RNA-binding protein [Desulforhopalus sp. IMCC35007]TKB06147.1 GntR family transcriptional regulator [Desulforhopalus sp. IMCC35007]
MVQIGKINRLLIKEIYENGILLSGGEAGDVLLKSTPSGKRYLKDDTIDVFVYVDKQQQLMATVHRPTVLVGECATLTVVSTSPAGAFLGWGLEDDLFVPKGEQQNSMRKGNAYVVYVYLSEKTHRITASSKLDKFLGRRLPEFKEGDKVDLLVYAHTDLGYSAVVNGSHIGVIYSNEVFQKIAIGQRLEGYVKKIRDDLKIDLRLQPRGYQQVDDISQDILETLKKNDGSVALSDKSPPEEIYTTFGVSKKTFKKAVGSLYKQKLIQISSDGIKLVS